MKKRRLKRGISAFLLLVGSALFSLRKWRRDTKARKNDPYIY